MHLVDAGQPGGGASAAAAGMLAPAGEAQDAGAFRDAAMASLRMWPEFAALLEEETGRSCGLRLDGLLHLADTPDAGGGLVAAAEQQRAVGIECVAVDAAAVAELEPAAGAAAAHGGLWYPREGHADSPGTVAALVDAVRRHGGTVDAGTRVIGRTEEGVEMTGDAAGTVSARWTVVAAGAWSDAVSRAAGGPALPVTPVRGQLVALPAPVPAPRCVLFAGRLGYAVSKADGRLLVGATEEDAGFDVTPDPVATARLVGLAALLVRGAGGGEAVPWVGLRPATPDRLPLVGVLCGSRDGGTAVATAHHRNGVLLAPLTGEAVARRLLDGGDDPRIAAFDPLRAAVQTA